MRELTQPRLITKPLVLTTSRQEFYEAKGKLKPRLVNAMLSNVTGGAVTFTLEFYNADDTTYYSIATGESIAANSRVLIEGTDLPLFAMAEGDKIYCTASANTSIHCLVTVMENEARHT